MTIGHPEIRRMLDGAAAQIAGAHEHLSKLDCAVGDGDHGTTILRTMEAASRTAAEHSSDGLQAMFSAVAWAVMSCDGGSTGPLLGSFFMGLSEGVGDRKELNHSAFILALEAGIQKLHKQSRANVGDKTMMDAFLPALDALKASPAESGAQGALAAAAAAAASGAEATKTMKAKFGRARNLGDRVLGHPDPGAVSVSLIFKGFSEALN
jgi:dihydroxyacetone kinase-like protein